MYRRRRYYKPRRTVRKYYKRRYPIRKTIKPKSVYDKVHLVKRYGSIVQDTTFVEYITNPAVDQSYAFHFRLNAVTGFTDFTNLYDMYKIRAVKVSFIPMANITTANESGFASLIYSTYDFNGESTVPTRDEIREYQYCKWSPYGRIHKRYFFPRVRDNANAPTTKVGPQNWMTTGGTGPNIQYNGLLVNVSNVPSIATDEPIYKVEVKYYLSFKNTK